MVVNSSATAFRDANRSAGVLAIIFRQRGLDALIHLGTQLAGTGRLLAHNLTDHGHDRTMKRQLAGEQNGPKITARGCTGRLADRSFRDLPSDLLG